MWGQPEVKLHRNALWPPNLGRRTPDQSETQCWGQRSHRGHAGSTRGQHCLGLPCGHHIWSKEPLIRVQHIAGMGQPNF